jgi:hypothetical protein
VGDVKEAKEILVNPRNRWMLTRCDDSNSIPLELAAMRGQSEMVKLLIPYHKQKQHQYVPHNTQGYHALLGAAHWWLKTIQNKRHDLGKNTGTFNVNGFPDVIQRLIDSYPDITNIPRSTIDKKNKRNPLYYVLLVILNTEEKSVAHNKAISLAKQLIKKGLSLDQLKLDESSHSEVLELESQLTASIEIKREPAKKEKNQSSFSSNKYDVLEVQEELTSDSEDEPVPDNNQKINLLELSDILDEVKSIEKCLNKGIILAELWNSLKQKMFTPQHKENVINALRQGLDSESFSQGLCCFKKRVFRVTFNQELLDKALKLDSSRSIKRR